MSVARCSCGQPCAACLLAEEAVRHGFDASQTIAFALASVGSVVHLCPPHGHLFVRVTRSLPSAPSRERPSPHNVN